MPFNWDHFLDFSKELFQQIHSREEAAWRSSISRSYYAIFHRAKAYADSRMYKFDSAAGMGRHKHLIEWYKSQEDATLKSIGDTLSRLQQRRVSADYSPFPPTKKKKAEDTLVECAALLEVFARLP